MTMSRTRLWVVGAAAVCVLLIVATWLLLVSPRRAEAARLVEERAGVSRSNQALRSQIAQLKQDAQTLPRRKADLAVIQQQLPASVEMARLVRDLDAAATASGLGLVAVTPAAAVSVEAATAPAAAAPATTTGTTAGAGAGSGTTTAAAGPSLVAVPVSIQVRGDYFEAALFVKKVQTTLQRLVLVGGTSVTQVDGDAGVGDPLNGVVDLTIAAQVYVMPSAGTAAGAAPVTPAPGAAAPASGTTTSGENS